MSRKSTLSKLSCEQVFNILVTFYFSFETAISKIDFNIFPELINQKYLYEGMLSNNVNIYQSPKTVYLWALFSTCLCAAGNFGSAVALC